MKYSILAAATAAAFALTPISASAVTASLGGTSTTVPDFGDEAGENDFIDSLTAAFSGGTLGFVTGGTISLSAPGKLIFTEVAAESGFGNDFFVGTQEMTETNNTNPFGTGENFLTFSGGETFTTAFGAGAVSGPTFTNNESPATVATLGDTEFGIFFDSTLTEHKTFFLAFDDNGAGPDDNHDDYIVRVEVVPVPLGALLIGTAFLGAGAVRRFGRKAA